MGGVISSQHNRTESSFGVDDGDGKYGVDPMTTHLNSQKVDCCIDGGDFVLSRSTEHSSMSH